MPRRARITAANMPHHIIQRGNNRSACFYAERDYLQYLEWLTKYALENECQVHAYVLIIIGDRPHICSLYMSPLSPLSSCP